MPPLLTSRSCALAVGAPPRPPVVVTPLLAITELKFNAVDAVNTFCFAAIARWFLQPSRCH